MLESIIEAIHGERKMSLNHWRYRLLHWAFATDMKMIWKDGAGRLHSPLPNYLYTHYCPLFHLTNLIILFAPIILFVKVVWAIAVIGYHVCLHIKAGIQKTINLYRKLRPKKEKTSMPEDVAMEKYRERLHQKELRSIPTLLVRFGRENDAFLTDFSHFYHYITSRCHSYYGGNDDDRICFSTEEEVKKIWEQFAPKVKIALESQKARKEKMRKTIVFWVNFSRIFIKGILNTFYFALFAAVIYITYLFGWPACKWMGNGVVWVVTGLLSLDWLGCLTGLGTFLLRVAIGLATVGGVGWLIYKFVPLNLLWEKTCPPFVAVGDFVTAFFRYVKNIFVGIWEFCNMFYEENCPPIIIVDDAEAAITEETK
ncbi:MAG: hypothetical protein M0R80_25740 [Proteobacteria bacterium]|jgi:hypothetical protein|nr:hypothetical protein [Pseudomonadota bacterium]